jgi:hypothetical protein
MKNKLNKIIESYLKEGLFNLSEIEETLLNLMDLEKDNIEYIIQYVLVLLKEPILDYDKAFDYLSNIKDIRAILLRSYIQDWYYGMPPDVDNKIINEYINAKRTNVEMSCLYYYASQNTEDVIDKVILLKKSLQIYQYNFLSILAVKKLLGTKGGFNVESYFEECIRFINRLNKTSYLSKQLIFKPFMYSKMLGLDRTSENILSLKQTIFKK